MFAQFIGWISFLAEIAFFSSSVDFMGNGKPKETLGRRCRLNNVINNAMNGNQPSANTNLRQIKISRS